MAFEPPPPGGYNLGSNFQPPSSAGGGGSNFQSPPPGGSNFPTNNGNNAPVGGGGPPTPTPTPPAAPTPSAPPPPNPGLTRVVLLATEAIRLDQTGKYKEAIQSYVYALEELLSLCRTETDIVKKNAYKSRAYTYMNRAEQLKKMLRARESNVRQQRYVQQQRAWADATFGKLLVHDVEGGEAQPTAYLAGGPFVCLFFGAQYCVKSQQLIPKLLELYGRVRAGGLKFKIIFCSQDRDQASFERFYAMQPWAALPFEERRILGMLKGKYNVFATPAVVVVKVSDGLAVVRDAAPQITQNATMATWDSWMQKLPENVQEQFQPTAQPSAGDPAAGASGVSGAGGAGAAGAAGAGGGGAGAGGSAGKYSVGARVEARSGGQSQLWVPGRVLTAHPTGQVDLHFDDGHVERFIPAMSVKPYSRGPGAYIMGCLVQARYKAQPEWWPGKITRVLKNGKYHVQYDKGKRESGVPSNMIRLRPLTGP